MKALTLALSLLACVILSSTARAAAPTTQPGVGVVIPAGITRAVLQAKINDAAVRNLPLNIDPGTYRVDLPLFVAPGMVVRSNGATLVGTRPGPILILLNGGTVQGLQFQGAVANVTGISGNLVRARICDCDFWTSLSCGVDGHGLLSRITDCHFGLAGDVPDHPFQHIRIRSADGSTNAWEIDHCAFYNAAGDCAVEVGDGYQLDFHHNNVERNRTRVAVKLAGMFAVHVHDNWVEANAGESQVELLHDSTNQIGNYVVNSHDNWWNLNGDGNRRAFLTFGACHVSFHDESGTSWGGKQIASEPGKVDVGQHRLVGYQE